MKKHIQLTMALALLWTTGKAQNANTQLLKQTEFLNATAQENHRDAYELYNILSNNGFQRKSTRYRIIGSSATEKNAITDTARLKYTGNRESVGLVNNSYILYQVAYPYEGSGYDELINYKKVGNNYLPNTKYAKKYNADGTVSQTTDSLFGQVNRYTYTYNANKKVETALGEVNYGSGFQNLTKHEYTYATGVQTKKVFNWTAGSWNLTATEYTYGTAQPDSIIYGASKKYYTYDGSGNMLTYIEHNTNGPIKKEEWTYNSSGKVTEVVLQSWSQGAWTNNSKKRYTYNAGGHLDSFANMGWNATQFVNGTLAVYTYQSGKLSEYTNYNWNGTWQPNNRFEFKLDAQQNLNQVHFYANQGGTLTFVRRYRYYYESYTNTTSTQTDIAQSNNMLVYPNPAAFELTFEAEIAQEDAVTFRIYDLAGKQITEKVALPEMGLVKTTLSLREFALQSGAYLYSVETAKGTQTGKFMITR